MKLGIYIGSFNPVHKGHIKIIRYVLSKNIVDKVLVVSTRGYWDKQNLLDLKYRIDMLKMYENDKIVIEEELSNLQYTYELMRELNKRYKNEELYLIIGADNIVNFDKWKNYEELLKYNLVIYNRNGIDIKCYLNKLNKKDKYIILDKAPELNISSTMIRNNINNNDLISRYLDKKIIEYIRKKKLYLN